jgi:phosphoglycerate dehydrogenase-like enzyme
MSIPKVVLYSNRENEIDEYERLIREAALDIQLCVCRSQEDVDAQIVDAEIVFGVHLEPQSYARAKKLAWIQSMWAGVEGLVKAPLPAGVIITKPWGVFGQFLSHYVFGNLLAQKINLLGARDLQAKKKWQPYRIETLNGKCMGIAGMGNIAGDIAAVAKAFGMSVWALNSNGRSHPLADRSFASSQREAFVEGADVLVLTLPATPATRGMFDSKLLAKMKSDAWIINVGRGALIDDAALIKLLEEKRITGAILDVFNEEPLPAEHPYWKLENCVVTPHIGGPSLPKDICGCFFENFKRYKNGETLLGLIDLQRGY